MNNSDKSNFEKANSPKEVLDLVDKNDQIIGTVKREIANKDPKLIHREIAVLLFDKNKNTVIQKRSRYKTVHPNMWSVLAGHIPVGEDPEKVAYQELFEEYGIKDIKLEFLTKKYMEYDHESHFMYYFIGQYRNEKIAFDESEVSEVRVVSRKEIQKMIKLGESLNEKHLPVINKVFKGEIKATFL